MINQCQGCQAGWPLKLREPLLEGLPPRWSHEVIGGYEFETCACTAEDYMVELMTTETVVDNEIF
jgi:hypothetical protein